jgi:hypothetical protein
MRWASENASEESIAALGQVNFTLATPQQTFLKGVDVDAITLPGAGMISQYLMLQNFLIFL